MGKTQGGLSCHEVALNLQVFLDKEADPNTAEKIEIHLADCKKCGMKASTFKAIKSVIEESSTPVPSHTLMQLREFSDSILLGDIESN